MPFFDFLTSFFLSYTFRTVALGSAILGLVSGALGAYAVLRKQSLLGDAMSHAALPGVVIAFIVTRSKEPGILMLGALGAGWLGTLLMLGLTRSTRLKADSTLGLLLSVFFGFGLMLLTFVQKMPEATQAGLDKFLFGQAATLLERDVLVMGGVATVVLVLVVVLWKEFKLVSFDPSFGASLGFPMRALDVLLTTLLVVAIVVGLQTVGVVLMSAMVVAPAIAARQWTDRLAWMVGLAAAFGALAGVTGTFLSSTAANLATGPMIVLCASALVLVSIFFAPAHGLAWAWVQRQRQRRQLRVQTVLSDLYLLATQHGDATQHSHALSALQAMNHYRGGVEHTLRQLAAQGLVRETAPRQWVLTPAGLAEAQKYAQPSA